MKGLLHIQNIYKLNVVLDIKSDFLSSRSLLDAYLLYLLVIKLVFNVQLDIK